MLDQRRAEEKGYITLKEAAEIANYTPDYIGQLIRAGKIRGEQVYSHVAWVTTHSEIEAYLQDKSRRVSTSTVATADNAQKKQSFLLYVLIAFCAISILFMQYVFYVSVDVGVGGLHATREINNQQTVMVSSL